MLIFKNNKYYKDNQEITKEEYNDILSKLPKPKESNIDYQQIETLKQQLQETDYKTLKYIDGELTEEDYQPIKELRAKLRQKIRELEGK